MARSLLYDTVVLVQLIGSLAAASHDLSTACSVASLHLLFVSFTSFMLHQSAIAAANCTVLVLLVTLDCLLRSLFSRSLASLPGFAAAVSTSTAAVSASVASVAAVAATRYRSALARYKRLCERNMVLMMF